MQAHYSLTEREAGQRLDRFLSEQAALGISRSYAGRLIEENRVLLDGKRTKAGTKLRAGMKLDITVPEPEKPELLPEDIPLSIVYEDEDVLIVNKPKGMVVHPAAGHGSGTLVNAILHHCGDTLSSINGVTRPGIVHRIDKDTTGLLVICKNDEAHRSLSEQLRVHSITRRYAAIVCGNLREDSGTIDKPIGRHRTERKRQAIDPERGREAVTHYTVLERFGAYTLVECRLETGRTHQIRVHMASIGHPLLGDEVYGQRKQPFRLEGQCLHAKTLGFRHPRTGEYVEFDSEYPEYFTALLRKLRH